MLKNIALNRPLAFLDLETTGLDLQNDRIVEIGVLKVMPDGQPTQHTCRVNPGVSIPSEATAIHRINNADVANEPRFEQVVDELLAFLEGCDLAGFGLKRFDLRVLSREVSRAGRRLVLEGRALLDVLEIYHVKERRDLSAAVNFYLGREHQRGHSAAADAQATAQVLDSMLSRYEDLPRGVQELHQRFLDPRRVDSDGFFRRVEGEVRFAKGKYRNQPLNMVASEAPSYLLWLLAQSIAEDTRKLVESALATRQASWSK